MAQFLFHNRVYVMNYVANVVKHFYQRTSFSKSVVFGTEILKIKLKTNL